MRKLIYLKHVMETNTAEICVKDEFGNYTVLPLTHKQLLNILVDGMKVVRLNENLREQVRALKEKTDERT
jgi:AmiR/NasT family two-component response regulator